MDSNGPFIDDLPLIYLLKIIIVHRVYKHV